MQKHRSFLHFLLMPLRAWLAKRGRPTRRQPSELPPEALAKALAEAKFLHGNHAVEVRELSPGELPVLPRKAAD
jgi:hypothetical protein